MKTILLCSDLDRTLLPNGADEESPMARPLFARLAGQPKIRLAYVSGRDKDLVKEAIDEFHLPTPDFVIGDVGTTLYRVEGRQWQLEPDWQREIGRDWGGRGREAITDRLADQIGEQIDLQPEEKQNRYKVSYFTDPSVASQKLGQQITEILARHDIATHVVWSRDDAENKGLLDILPRRANKLQAIRFLMDKQAIEAPDTVFAGDSGNDLDVLASGMQAILVKNAADDVRQTALDRLSEDGSDDRLYLARGNFMGMNGNYAAGVLEGMAHFFPEVVDWF